MPEMHAREEELILRYYGEPPDDPAIEAHIAGCTKCQQALKELGNMLALVDAQTLPEPLAGLEQRVWARVEPHVVKSHASWLRRRFDVMPRWAIAGGVAAVVIAAFVAGRLTRPAIVVPAPQTATASNASRTEKVLLVAIGDHLDQSQMVLLELLNADPAQAADLRDDQERARELVAANRLYRQTALRAGDQQVSDVLDALERALLEIANAPNTVSARDLEALRTDIEQRGILFRVRVIASEMRAREQKDVMAAAQTGP